MQGDLRVVFFVAIAVWQDTRLPDVQPISDEATQDPAWDHPGFPFANPRLNKFVVDWFAVLTGLNT